MKDLDGLPPDRSAQSDLDIPELVAQVYCDASPPEKSRLLELLVRPLGLLPLFALADGVFARIWWRNGQDRLQQIRVEDALAVSGQDIATLVAYVQQSSVEVLDGLLQIINASPVLASSTAAIVVMLVLQRRARVKASRRSQRGALPG
ncbi:MAG: hypothetical protein JWM30_3416 [Burkholderia sp.]|nr:hypothetical protein [Burkholderia sp.]